MTKSQKVAVAIYGGILLLCVALIIIADFLGPAVRASILPMAVDAFKMVLAALVGAVSAILGVGAKSGSQN